MRSAKRTAINSVSVHEFDAAARIRHLDIYLQAAPIREMPTSYEGVRAPA